jgi:hypothetical protein
MRHRVILGLPTIAVLGLVLLPGDAVSQQKSLKDQLVGTWTLVSSTETAPDGKKVDSFGSSPFGAYMFDANGHFIQMLMRSDLPKFDNRLQGTPEQNKAVVQGSVAFYGTYALDEAAKLVTVHITGGSFAKFNGTDGKRVITSLTADELHFTNPATSGGTSADTVWRRAK